MSEPVLLDTGPLVAYLDRREQFHTWAVQRFSELSAPAFTCEAVLSEACFLLQQQPSAIEKIGHYLERGAIQMVPVGSAAQAEVFASIRRYRQIPMSYADACLLWLAESLRNSRVLTLDRDFAIDRLQGPRAVPSISPF